MKRFIADISGVSATEFALLLPFLALITAGVVDFGLAFGAKLQLSNAVSQGTQFAFMTGPTVTAGQVQTVVQTATSLPSVSVTTTYSGTSCYCLTGTPPALAAQTCGTPCADASVPGKYVSVTASYTYTPIFPSFGLIPNSQLSESAVVRVQ
jgi:Flp pilus assembly protein TadG